jgi:hypothetical protein
VIAAVAQFRLEQPVPPRQFNAKVPADLETICLKCLAKSPTARYAPASVLAYDLHRYRAGEPMLPRPVGTAERVWRWASQPRAIERFVLTRPRLGAVFDSIWLTVIEKK